jgi:hypothetical protein
MMSKVRQLVRRLLGRWLGERPIPVGGVARDRTLLRRALGGTDAGRVLVVGPGLAIRQALPFNEVDVAGTSPYSSEINVCSAVRTVGSLPPQRWDTVVVTDSGAHLDERLRAVAPACRASARLLVLGRTEQALPGQLSAISEVASIEGMLISQSHRLWVARMRA